MAPGKKKKKVASNPARGFATVSQPSKVKVNEDVAEKADVDTPTETSFTPDEVRSRDDKFTHAANDAASSANQQNVQNMTPEQLEAHLEDAEIQTLLDANGARCKSEVTRQLARLATERHQLRPQSHQLSLYPWLDDGVVEEIMQLYSSDTGTDFESHVSKAGKIIEENHKLLLDMWILQRLLKSLKLPDVDKALSYVLRLALLDGVNLSSDNPFGFVEALDWYNLTSSPKSLPDYSSFETSSVSQGYSTPPILNDPEPKTAHLRPGSNTQSTDEEDLESSDISVANLDDDDDDDPELFQERFLRLRTALWKNGYRTTKTEGQPTKSRGKSTRMLLERLSRIERDVLFDKDAAESAWNTVLQDLESEHFRSMKSQRHTKFSNNRENNNGSEARADAESNTGVDDLFGGMFITEEKPNTNPGAVNNNIRVLEFGKWTGLAPLTLLQEKAKSIDASFRSKVTNLSQSSHSVRKKLELFWTKDLLPEQNSVSALPSEIQINVNPRCWALGMESIATSESFSAEAYIATIALFLVLTIDSLDSKVTNRLPGVWRNVLTDLNETRKAIVNENDKSELKELRKTIQRAVQALRGSQRTEQHYPARYESTDSVTRKAITKTDRSRFDAAHAQKQWQSRESRPALDKMHDFRRQLPIYTSKNNILAAINQHPVVIICAETGSGKSTQTGSFILENELKSGRDCHILVTQPRRISAISLARRVSEELGEGRNDLGTNNSLIGYAIRLESKTSSSTRLTFATTGVLLRMFESSPMLEQLDYLILDEVHERTMDLDLLFIALRRLQQKRPGLKIVLMSATVNAKVFSDYFGGAPVLDIPGRTYPVEVLYLEDAIEATNDLRLTKQSNMFEEREEQDEEVDESSEEQRPALRGLENYSNATRSRLSKIDEYRIDYDLLTRLTVAIATKRDYAKYSSAILIFMPGIAEIRRLHNILSTTEPFTQNWVIHLLHSSFSTDELERAFTRPPPGHKKIVIATNIAETGITIPDVTAVIDTCKEKILRFDERRQLSKLTEGFISRSSARQRRGRAARVQDGLCFHFVTRYRHDNLLLEQQIPEMLRLSLQDAILRVKIWGLGSIEETLAQAISPPSRKNILRAIDKLKDAGALTKSEQLTPLGNEIARLPLEVTLAKLAVLGTIFRCLDPILTIISILTSKSPFLNSMHDKNAQSSTKRNFSRADSDLLTNLNAYESWRRSKIAGSSLEFCRKNHLSHQNLVAIEDQKIQLLVYLVDAELVVLSSEEKTVLGKARLNSGSGMIQKVFHNVPERYNRKVSDEMLLCIIAMAFYPRVLVREWRAWRNVYTNQQINLTAASVNHVNTTANPPKWLSFYEAMQSKSGNLNVFETSAIPEIALAVLLGDAEVKIFSGFISLDNERIRLTVKNWKLAQAIKILRRAVKEVLHCSYKRPGESLSAADQRWIDILLKMTAVANRPSNSMSITL